MAMDTLWLELAKLGGYLFVLIFLFWLARAFGLGGDVRIRDVEHARKLADEAICGFDPVEIALDRAGIAALMKDAEGRHLLIRRHGAQFAARILDGHTKSRLDQNFLTIGTSDKSFGKITLNLGTEAQFWAAGLRHMKV
jgi:hypothetical protein